MDGDEAVRHLVDGHALGLDLAAHGVLLVALGQSIDDTVEGGREQQGLVLTFDVAQHPFDLRKESHVGHAVGLIDDDVCDVVEEDLFAFDEVDEASRGGDDEVDALGQLLDLLFDICAAVHGQDASVEALGNRLQFVLHLGGEFSRGHQGECPRALWLGDIDELQHREAERQGLAGPGLGLAADVVAFQGGGNREFLDFEWVLETSALEAVDDLGQQPQISEFFGHVCGSAIASR